MAFGAYIRKKREEKDIQLNDFAKLLDISPAYWSRIERELEKPPKDELIRKAAEHLGLDVDDAFVRPAACHPTCAKTWATWSACTADKARRTSECRH